RGTVFRACAGGAFERGGVRGLESVSLFGYGGNDAGGGGRLRLVSRASVRRRPGGPAAGDFGEGVETGKRAPELETGAQQLEPGLLCRHGGRGARDRRP